MDWNGKQVRLSPEEVEVSSLEVLIVKGERKHRAEIYKDITFKFLWNSFTSNLTIISMSRIKTKRIRYLCKKNEKDFQNDASDTFFLRLKFSTCWVIVLLKRICSSWFLNWGWSWSECPRRHKRHTLLWCSEKSFFFLLSIQINLRTYSACVQLFSDLEDSSSQEKVVIAERANFSLISLSEIIKMSQDQDYNLPLWDNKDVMRSRL